MTMKIDILISGAAICYIKDDLWNIVFITDKKHPVKFSDDGSEPEDPLRKEGMDREITIFAHRPKNNKPSKADSFKEGVLNMHGRKMHGDKGNHKLNVVRKNGVGREIIKMMIPTGEGSLFKYTEKNYVVQQVKPTPPGDPIKLKKKVAKTIKIELEIKKGLGAAMTLHDAAGTSANPYAYEDGKTLCLQFDNDCRKPKAKKGEEDANDFEMYYEWLKDLAPIIGGTREFLAGEEISRGMYGNCDPVDVDPPPGP